MSEWKLSVMRSLETDSKRSNDTSDNNNLDPRDRMAKVRSLVNMLNQKFAQ